MKHPLFNGRRAQRQQWLDDIWALNFGHVLFGDVAANDRAAAVLRARKDARRLRRQAAARTVS